MRNAENITWVEGEEHCRWKGKSVSPNNCISLFGVKNPEPEAEGPGFLLIDGTFYCSSVRVVVNIVKKIARKAAPLVSYNLIWGNLGESEPVISASDLGLFADIKRIKPYSDINKDLKMKRIREFVSDLDAYYEEVNEEIRPKHANQERLL